jgi:hypothetical protein
MSTMNSVSNVYYLAPPAVPALEWRASTTASTLRHRLLDFWSRLRLTTSEVVATLRRFGRVPIEVESAFLDQRAEMILAAPPRPAGPARVIDFAAARTRLRA